MLFAFVLSACSASVQSEPKFESLGDDTYTVSVRATHKFTRNTRKLAALVTDAAEAFCAKEGRVIRAVAATLAALIVAVALMLVPFTALVAARIGAPRTGPGANSQA